MYLVRILLIMSGDKRINVVSYVKDRGRIVNTDNQEELKCFIYSLGVSTHTKNKYISKFKKKII